MLGEILLTSAICTGMILLGILVGYVLINIEYQ